MAIREVREIGDDILTKQCKEVTRMTFRTKLLITDMLETVERAAALLEETEAAARGMRSDMAALTGRPTLFL